MLQFRDYGRQPQLVFETPTVSIITVPVEQKMLTHERSDLLVMFRATVNLR